MKFRKGIPILYSSDVLRSVAYYTSVLGFDNHWTWGDPPTFAGISKDSFEIFFCEKGQGNPGTWMSVFVDKVDEYHDLIKSRGAQILVPPVDREWGVREMLVQDPDAHKIRFGCGISIRDKSSVSLPEQVRIVVRKPSLEEELSLVASVGWTATGGVADQQRLNQLVFSVVAEDTQTGTAIGCAEVASDLASIYYIKNVIVRPEWQNQRIGAALMQAVTHWIDANALEDALVTLFTGENLAPFYRQFGFNPGYGMTRKPGNKK
ncbi:putative acyltransferase [Flavihumibacter petaseus NBRC 106054]|uniref:Putative acyltransferase n=2 Tax=Flavihumibacter TaxID=1004301 RepID=A0A0E9MZH2_9BACT|nr:putative acyltransferase [Flavihumibacter petaseus NBRC 106054]